MDETRLKQIEALLDREVVWGETTVEELVAEVRRLRQLLVEYGRHTEGCSAAHGDRYRCRCGWREVAPEFVTPAGEATQAGQR